MSTILSRTRAFRQLIYSAAAFALVAATAIGFAVWTWRADSIDDEAAQTESIAAALGEQLDQFARSIDFLFADIQERIQTPDIASAGDLNRVLGTQQTYFLLKERSARFPQVAHIELIGPRGDIVNSTRGWPPGQHRPAKAEGVQARQGPAKHDIRVNSIDDWTANFTRTIAGTAGGPIGEISIVVNFRRLQPLFESMTARNGRFVMLIGHDGAALLRHPHVEARQLADLAADAGFRSALARGGGSHRAQGSADQGMVRIAIRPLRDHPMAVAVGFSEAAALQKWSRQTTFIAGGALVAVLCSIFLARAVVQQFHRLVSSERSLTEREGTLAQKTRELEDANNKLDVALNNMSQGLCMFDEADRLVVCNSRYLQMYGLSPLEVHSGCSLRSILERRRETGLLAEAVEKVLGDLRVWLARGDNRGTTATRELGDGRVISIHRERLLGGGWISTHEDVTERQRTEARIAHMARHDPLTDLGNRSLFSEFVDVALARLQRNGERFCVLLIDLDLFKLVNDSLGHPVGDALLKAIAQRLLGLVRKTDTVARLGGDEFAILQTCFENHRQGVIALAEKLIAAFSQPFVVEGHQITIGASVGIAIAPEHGADVGQLVKNADLALYRAKSEGRNCYRFFEASMDIEARQRRELEVALRQAISRGEFQLHYQPMIDIATGKVCGAEALVRWIHPNRGMIAPDKFIPLAEELGLIVSIGEWIVRKACYDAARWPSWIKVSVNLSPVQFKNGDIVSIISEALASSRLPASRLELEITETVLLEKSENNVGALHRLKQLGVSVALDDFGTGYSSLSYLRLFPFDKIKIDRSFVRDMLSHVECGAIVSAVVGLGRTLDVVTTAEGVETAEQLTALRAAGCTQAQGYLIGRPCVVSELPFMNDSDQRRVTAG